MSGSPAEQIVRTTRLLFYRLLIAAAFALSASALAEHVGAMLATLIMALVAVAMCSLTATFLGRSHVGQISFVNRLAPITLPLGFNIARGKLWPIVVCSSTGWTTIAAIAALHATLKFQLLPSPSHGSGYGMSGLLIAALLIDGIGFCYLATLGTKRLTLHSPGLQPMLIILSILLGMMIAARIVWGLGYPGCAVLVAAAPGLIVGAFYAALFLIMRNQRPN